MAELEIPISVFFQTAEPSAASVPHLITCFDAELLQAIVRINGAKLGAWPLFAPFNAEDQYDTSRENVPLSAWALPLNQQELLNLGLNVNSLIFDGNTLLVDNSSAEKVLEECEAARGEQGYEDLPDIPSLVAQIHWALIPVGQDHDYALFVASREKMDYFNLLAHWCHERGRDLLDVRRERRRPGAARLPRARGRPAGTPRLQYGQEFLSKMAHHGISPLEALTYLATAMRQQQTAPADNEAAVQDKPLANFPLLQGLLGG